MPVFTFGVDCNRYQYSGTDGYGQDKYASTPVKEKVAVIHLKVTQQKTSVRVDSSASRGHAREEISQSKFLFNKLSEVALDDRIEVRGVTLRVISVEPRFTIFGKLDHIEVGASLE